MWHRTSREADPFSAGQEIPCCSVIKMFNMCLHFNIIFWTVTRSPKLSLPFRLPDRNSFVCILE